MSLHRRFGAFIGRFVLSAHKSTTYFWIEQVKNCFFIRKIVYVIEKM